MAPSPRPGRRSTHLRIVSLTLAGGLTVAACADAATTDSGAAGGSDVSLPPPLVLDVPDPDSVYDPVRAGEPVPDGFRQLLGRDDIAPVYDPTFVAADGVSWPDESLVIGVDLDGEARAYPVGFLNRREIVNDRHRGIPTLVTW